MIIINKISSKAPVKQLIQQCVRSKGGCVWGVNPWAPAAH